ncbi:unnamed protein product [Linum tenue]|uniref:Uncharacterized protein n=1 Tax=Linum tenue TaxID=586396 RepID=A0AAV0HHB3_9ROSI|nr:unnamed protein product [Linum tenue]
MATMEFTIAPDEDPADKIYKGFFRDISDSRLEEALEHSGYKYDGAAHYILDNFVAVRRTVVGNRVQIHAQLKEEDRREKPDQKTESEAAEGKPFDSADPNAVVKEEQREQSDKKPFVLPIAAVPLSVVPAEQLPMQPKEELEAAEILAGGMRTVKDEPIETEMVSAKVMTPEAPATAEEKPFGAEAVAKAEDPVEAETAIKAEEPAHMEAEKTASKDDAAGAADTAKEKTQPSAPKIPEKPVQRIIDGLVVEDGEFPEERGYYLVGRTMVTAVSTSRGRKLADNEIVYFNYSKSSSKSNAQWIVRFSTKRCGEVGRLPMEWGKTVVPLMSSPKVKVLGRCVAAPATLQMMQEVFLYVSFYIHRSMFITLDSSTWTLESNTYIDPSLYPLLSLFKLLELKPYQKAEFTPSELHSRKRGLKLEDDADDSVTALQLVKKRKGGGVQIPEQEKDEQAFSESMLNKIVGTAEVYDLMEMEAPCTLTCHLKPYQKQALRWMCESEEGMDDEKASKLLHPCWAAYNISDERAASIYVNIFSGEATFQFPAATQITRGGILADAMGLGKTVMTIALLLARPGRGSVVGRPRGGTLIICPMALLHQWKDELETHAKPGSMSVFVHYGGERMNDPRLISGYDVILTTYGVLTAAYKQIQGVGASIFHKVEWFRVVLDEAHIIKSQKSQGAQASFLLSSQYRWCLTGTPLQNNLEDIYSLLCFLHVEPWSNWSWWNKLIHKPYENGDPRALKLIKAILRPLMLRRTKETKDNYGRPILVLPPTEIQVLTCEQSEAERDLYEALFRRSKEQFDSLVAQGQVLHKYASVLELLLRLRQCCNHPFLVMSRADLQKYWDLNKLAKRFFETNDDYVASTETTAATQANGKEAVEGSQKGEHTECPICLESADDPVLTPCKHRMCRECLLTSWTTNTEGPCPLCRTLVSEYQLRTCPSGTKFKIDIHKNWKGSSKITKLLDCLERIDAYYSGEKSIIFSQWTSFLDLLEIPLREKGVEFLRFDGTLSQKHRERVLKEFNESSVKRVLLMSLKTGGVGLNLTAASNVFIMDPWWNPAVEEQAIMRIHRIGQKRTVRVRRFIVKGTVEERLLQVQAKKQKMIAGALAEDDVRTSRIEDLKMLFR